MNIVKHTIFFIFIISTGAYSQVVSTLVTGPSTFNDGLAIDNAGNLYASMYAGTTVTKITKTGQTSIFMNGMTSPNGLAFGPDGSLYVPSVAGHRITKATVQGDTAFYMNIQDPGAVYINNDGSMLVAQYNLNKIMAVDAAKNVSLFMSDSGKLNGPIGLLRDKQGILYIGNFNDGKVFRYTPDKGLVLIGQIPGSLGFMTIVNDMIFATGFAQHRIYRIPINGGGAVVFVGSGTAGSQNGTSKASFNGPNGIVASLTGDSLYVSDYHSRSLRVISGVLKFTTSVKQEHRAVQEFRLEQNFPNPFNPSTVVAYSVPVRTHITLKVYSVLGAEVATLADGPAEAGNYTAQFNAAGLASGTYLIRLTAGTTVRTVKATVIK